MQYISHTKQSCGWLWCEMFGRLKTTEYTENIIYMKHLGGEQWSKNVVDQLSTSQNHK